MRSARLAAVALLWIAVAGCSPSYHFATGSGPALYPEPAPDAITFWGHACAYLDIGGTGIVTDPVFEASYAPLHRRRVAAPPPEAYDQARIVLISHAHQDHLSPKTLARFSPQTVILCPAAAVKYLVGLDRDVRIMRPGDSFFFDGGKIVAVAAHHPGGRHSLKARADGRALGYVIEGDGHRIYYSGDTDFFAGFDAVGSEFHPDLALLNINVHLHSEDAMRAIGALRSPTVVPLHFGAYGGNRPGRSARWRHELVSALGSVMVPLEIGETLRLGLARSPEAKQPSPRAYPVLSSPVAEAAGIPRFAEIEPGLARGGHPDARGLRYLAAGGFHTVVSFRKDPSERAMASDLGLEYVEIPLRAGLFSASPPTEAQLREFFSVVRDSSRRPVYIHCQHGRDRTGMMAALYRIEACGWTPDEAVAEMKAFGFHTYYRRLLQTVRDYRPGGRVSRIRESMSPANRQRADSAGKRYLSLAQNTTA